MTGKEFDEIRKLIGWAKEETAKRLGVSRITVHNYIKKEKIPEPVAKLMRIFKSKMEE